MATPAPKQAKKAPRPCVTVKDVPSAAFITAYAAHLKKANWIKLPAWVDLVKTSRAKELAPIDPDWYYVRAGLSFFLPSICLIFSASVARKIYLRRGVGVGKLRTVYGGNKRRGPRPEKFTLASGAVLRHVVKQLESIGVVEKSPAKRGYFL